MYLYETTYARLAVVGEKKVLNRQGGVAETAAYVAYKQSKGWPGSHSIHLRPIGAKRSISAIND